MEILLILLQVSLLKNYEFAVAQINPDMTDTVSALSEEKQIARTEIPVSVRDIDLLAGDALL